MLGRLILAAALAGGTAASAQPCAEIRFAPGTSSGRVDGVAPADGGFCYRIAVGAGQEARVRITGTNMVFTIPGLVDAVDEFAWTTEAGDYEIQVGQLFRSVTDQAFVLTISVTGG